ncbi:MAG: M16 family metallopeptidase [Gemmatimonadales bacterium]
MKPRFAKSLVTTTLVLLAGLSAAAAAQQPTRVTSVEGITEYTLPNGLRVLLFPDASKPTITVNITFFVGSRHEGYGETGMAHLLEHLDFKGTPNHPDIPQELTEHGAQPNGTTWFDRTNYFETFPATEEHLAWALDLEADRMVNSFISKEDLESEMTVVRNEMELGENSPFGVLMARTMSTMYLWHNYGNSTIGDRADVEQVPIERLQAFYRKYYQPDNAMLVVAGKFDEKKTLELVVEKFGAIPRPDRSGANHIYPTYTAEPTQDGERSVTLRRVGDVQIAMAAYHVPPGSHEQFAAISILSHVLGNQPSGRLYKALVEPGKAARVGTFAFQLKEAGPLLAFAQVREEDSLDEAAQILRQTLDEVASQPITDEEVERARSSLIKNIDLTFNSSQRIALGLSEWAAMGDWRLFFVHRDRVRTVTTEEVNLAATAYLKPQNRTLGLFIPTDSPDRATIPTAPDVAALVKDYEGDEAIAEGEEFDPSPDNIESRTTRNTFPSGFKVALLPKNTRGETVAVTFRVLFGTESSLMNKSAAGNLAASMLMRGSKEHSRQEISDEFDRLKARVSIFGGVSSASGSIETTRENLPAVLRLVREVVREPSFQPDEFQQLKEERLADLESNKSEPQALGSIAFARHMSPWPKGHPRYVATIDEQIDAIESTTVEDARRFYDQFYGAARGHMAIVGDFDADEIWKTVEQTFGDWTAKMASARVPSVYRDIKPERIVIETPDKANAFFRAGMNLDMGDDDPDYPAMVLANYIMGGGFLNSRLATRIRQNEGLSYFIASIFSAHPVDHNGQFGAVAIYAPENRDRLEAAFKEEIELALEKGFTDEEVAKAKDGYLQSQGLARAQDRRLASMLSQGLYFDRTMTWDKELEKKIAALTPDQLLQAMRRHIDPDKLTVVVAGDFKKAVVPE